MEERRQDYPAILDRLEDLKEGQDSIREEQANVKIELAKVATQVEERNRTAIEWREGVCKKFTDMKTYCYARQESKTKIWIAIIAIIAGGLISWGETHRQVVMDTERITRLEQPLFTKDK
jgi:hypothetical protein